MNNSRLGLLATVLLLWTGFDPTMSKAPASETANSEVKRDTGPVAGPARQAGLTCLGRLRTRRSEDIGGSRWGVSCHWIADEHPLSVEKRLDQLADLGAKWAFLVPDWERIERDKGIFEWNTPSHRFDDVVRGMVRRKIKPVIQIYGGNRLYMTAQPDPNKRRLADAARLLDDAEVRDAWHRFLEAMVRRYRADVGVWEIWNEPNGPWFWQTPATIQDYGRMVQRAAEIIRRVQPEAVVLAGSTANVPLDYLEGFLASEGARSFDRWSVHPYGDLPEAADVRIRQVRELLRAQGKPDVLWQSECGFPSSADTGGWGYGGPWDETKHAKWVLRRLLADASLDMEASIYFVLHDYPAALEGGPDRGKMGINRKGLYFADSWEPKPAAHAFRHLAGLIDDNLEPALVKLSLEILDPGPFAEAARGCLRTYTLLDKKTRSPVIVYWLAVPMATKSSSAKARFILPGDCSREPVLVDLLDGGIYAANGMERDGRTTFEDIPLGDSPLVLCSRRLVEVQP
ncbi:MAG: cellulase family glycosylhydrolase [Pirellulales bacterium]|nr:cellulase family glycosylhydrolase [Pirellulales bacterium]